MCLSSVVPLSRTNRTPDCFCRFSKRICGAGAWEVAALGLCQRMGGVTSRAPANATKNQRRNACAGMDHRIVSLPQSASTLLSMHRAALGALLAVCCAPALAQMPPDCHGPEEIEHALA